MGFLSTSDAISLIQEEQTDADSDINELLISVSRKNFEQMLIKTYYTGVSGTLTSTPTGAGVCTNTSASMGVDDHIGHTVIFTSGSAKGNMYTIDDNDATTFTLTGDDPAADGVLSGDAYMIFYDLLNYTSGHVHDGVSAPPLIPYRMSIYNCLHSTYEWSTNQMTFQTATVAYIYLPEGAQTMRMAAYVGFNGGPGNYGTFRFQMTNNSNNMSTNQDGPVWITGSYLDVSSFAAGYYQVSIQFYSASTAYYARLWGFNLYVE